MMKWTRYVVVVVVALSLACGQIEDAEQLAAPEAIAIASTVDTSRIEDAVAATLEALETVRKSEAATGQESTLVAPTSTPTVLVTATPKPSPTMVLPIISKPAENSVSTFLSEVQLWGKTIGPSLVAVTEANTAAGEALANFELIGMKSFGEPIAAQTETIAALEEYSTSLGEWQDELSAAIVVLLQANVPTECRPFHLQLNESFVTQLRAVWASKEYMDGVLLGNVDEDTRVRYSQSRAELRESNPIDVATVVECAGGLP
jgi:hypothetical protein